MSSNHSRRDFIAVTGTLAAAVAFPGCGSRKSSFFSTGERRAIAALADRLIPPDADPGASALGAGMVFPGSSETALQ